MKPLVVLALSLLMAGCVIGPNDDGAAHTTLYFNGVPAAYVYSIYYQTGGDWEHEWPSAQSPPCYEVVMHNDDPMPWSMALDTDSIRAMVSHCGGFPSAPCTLMVKAGWIVLDMDTEPDDDGYLSVEWFDE